MDITQSHHDTARRFPRTRLGLKLDSRLLDADRRLLAVGTGLLVGGLGALVALALVFVGVPETVGIFLGVLAGLYLLTSLDAALIVVLALAGLLPFGAFPVKIAFTPSLIDCAMAGFLTVYLFQWMTGKRRQFVMTPPSWFILAFMVVISFAFIFGLQNGRATPNLLKTFAELLLSISMALILADIASDAGILRRITGVLLLVGTLAAAIGIGLWLLPDPTADALLSGLARFEYPSGAVLRYREDGVSVLNERAIGTWIDPNAYSGFLMMVGGLAGAQMFSAAPVLRWRGIAFACFALIVIAMLLSDSRGSFLALVAGLGTIAALRYRRVLWLMLLGGVLLLFLPPTQAFVARLLAGLQGQDLETQMRLGEYKDALNLISRYPVFGVGFSGVPEIDLYVGVSSTYLILASYTGFLGIGAYALAVGGSIVWGLRRWGQVQQHPLILDVWLGLLAGIIGALVGGIVDHFYFNPQFQATSLIFWSFIGLFLAGTRLVGRSQGAGERLSPPTAAATRPTLPR